MYRPTPTPKQVLDHCEVSGFSGLFVLGFQERHVNLYSQQVRALNLALALELEGRLKLEGDVTGGERTKLGMENDCVEVCVIGGGAGGAMAAAAFAKCGCKVTLFESKEDILKHPGPEPESSESKRTIHPHLMHWPYVTGRSDEAGLPFMSWEAGEIDKVLRRIKKGFFRIKKKLVYKDARGDSAKVKSLITVRPSTRVHSIARTAPEGKDVWHARFKVKYFASINTDMPTKRSKHFDLVILATGFGAERSYREFDFHSYWQGNLLDKLKDQGESALVSGIGDGGVEDAIQLALEEPTAVHELLPFLFDRPDTDGGEYSQELRDSVRALKSWLSEIEEKAHGVDISKQSAFLEAKWKEGLTESPDKSLLKVIEQVKTVLADKRKKKQITITLNSSEPTYHSLGSSVVHRFILYCLEQMYDSKTVEIDYIQGKFVPELSPVASTGKAKKYAIQTKDELKYKEAKMLIVRHGPTLGFESIKFEPADIRTAIRDLRMRNVLDQTRFPMWPIYGNPKRFARFREVRKLNPKRHDALADNLESKTNKAKSKVAKPESSTTDSSKNLVFSELVMHLAPRPLDKTKKPQTFTKIEFVYVPAGKYLMGQKETSNPPHIVELKGFWISRHPITVQQYVQFVRYHYHEWPVQLRDVDVRGRLESAALKRGEKPNITSAALEENRKEFIAERLDHPITDISWVDAMHYCQWAGFSLPTAAQWEAACTGHLEGLSLDDSPHVRGFSYEYIHFRRTGKMTGTNRVGTFIIARSPFGVVQQLGNVWEFLLDSWDENPKHFKEFSREPVTFNDSRQREFRGGSWFDYDHPSAFERGHNGDRNRNGRDGFRVVWMNPNKPGDEENLHDEVAKNHGRHQLQFPQIDEKTTWEALEKSSAKYLATPALRRLYAVYCRKKAEHKPEYLKIGELKNALSGSPVDIVLGWHNTDPNTDQRFSALSCDAWYISELTEALLQNKTQPGHVRTRLAQEVLPTLKENKFVFSNHESALISIGSGSVNAATQALVDYDIVPGFEQSTNSTVFGKEHFFANPEDAANYGVLVAFREIVGKKSFARIVVAGRSGFATAAGIAFLTKQLRDKKHDKDRERNPKEDKIPRLLDDQLVQIVFKVDRKSFPSESKFQQWQDAGIPDLNTFELVEPESSHVT